MGLDLVDLDVLIEDRIGMTIAEIFSRYGEDHFRDLESDILQEICTGKNQLIVPGAGIVVREANREKLRRSSHIIWLRIGIDEVMRRVSQIDDLEKRPLIENKGVDEGIAALLARRERFYRECDALVDVDGKEFAYVVGRVIDMIHLLGFTGQGIEKT